MKAFNSRLFFTIDYTKKDGSTNAYVVRRGVRRWKTADGKQAEVNGTGHATPEGLVRLYSANRKGYRMFDLKSIAQVKQSGVIYSPEVISQN